MRNYYLPLLFIGSLLLVEPQSLVAQNVGIGTQNPEATLHINGTPEGGEMVYVDFENSNAAPLNQVGLWGFNVVAFAGELSTNSGYLPAGSKNMNYNVTVPAGEVILFSYAYKNDISPNGTLTLPFGSPQIGDGGNSPWEQASHTLAEGTYNIEWKVERTGPEGTIAGLLYVDEIRTTQIFCLDCPAPGVGIGILDPHNSAILDVRTNSHGMLVPRMTMAQRDNILNPAQGLLVFNLDSKELNYYDAIINQWIDPVSDEDLAPLFEAVNFKSKQKETFLTPFGNAFMTITII